MKNHFIWLFIISIAALVIRFILFNTLDAHYPIWIRLLMCVAILVAGTVAVLKNAADIIEETTEVLSERTKIASGLFQSLGTAFPDMALGIVAAFTSLSLRAANNEAGAVSFAIIAAATTFGSNIYNIGHAVWCIFRQNQSDDYHQPLPMFPGFKQWGMVKPVITHAVKPVVHELDIALDAINALSLLTAAVAIGMVLFGKVTSDSTVTGDLYQLIRPYGIILVFVCILILFKFRHNERDDAAVSDIQQEEKYYRHKTTFFILVNLLISGAVILLTAEAMIHAIETMSEITHLPVVITGVLSGIIGCLGEMIVVHNFSIHPNGRIGDAIMGVAMDNIVTTLGAAIVAVMGGIFLGGSALIIIFVIILTLNSLLEWQISKLKNACFDSAIFSE